MRNMLLALCFAALLCVPCAVSAGDQADKTILKRKGAEPETVDSASYSRSAKEYKITKGNTTISLPKSEVEYCKPPRPAEFTAPSDIGKLEKVIEKYHQLWWDVQAFRMVMPLYLEAGKHGKAIQAYTEMKSVAGDPMPTELQRDYWTALRKDDRQTVLKKELSDTIARGSREASAWAYLTRGDILLGEGKLNEALLDGYMKTVVLFDDIAPTRKLALEKTVKTLQDLNDGRAEKFRRILQKEFPQ